VPTSGKQGVLGFAARLSDLSLVPVVRRVFDELPRDRVVATQPPAGTTAHEGDEATVLVSAGFPRVAFSDGEDVLLVDGASGKRLGAVAAGPRLETTRRGRRTRDASRTSPTAASESPTSRSRTAAREP
jgi:hypothetical protein